MFKNIAKKETIFYIFLALAFIGTIVFLSCLKVANIEAHADEIPVITVSTEEWNRSVSVNISYPSSVLFPKYRTVKNGIYSDIKSYNNPFDINTEGETEVQAFYSDDQYVSKFVNNIDITPPAEPYVYLYINLMTEKNIVLQVRVTDAKSGIDRVAISVYGYQFEEQDGVFELNLSNITIGESFNIEIYDNAGNKRTHSGYYYSVFPYTAEIRNYASIFENLGDGSQFTPVRWADIISKFEDLEMSFQAPFVNSSEINSLKLEIDELIKGDISFSTRIEETLIGMDSDILYAVSVEDLDVLLGSEIVLEISNCFLTVEQKASYERNLVTLSGFSKINLISFNLSLREKTGASVVLIGGMNIDFKLPDGYLDVKLFDLEDGVFTEIPLAVASGRRSARIYSEGAFFVVANADNPLGRGNGYLIDGRYYSLGLFWGIIGGIIGLLTIVFFVTYFLISNKDKLSSNKLLSKIRKRNIERKKERRK